MTSLKKYLFSLFQNEDKELDNLIEDATTRYNNLREEFEEFKKSNSILIDKLKKDLIKHGGSPNSL